MKCPFEIGEQVRSLEDQNGLGSGSIVKGKIYTVNRIGTYAETINLKEHPDYVFWNWNRFEKINSNVEVENKCSKFLQVYLDVNDLKIGDKVIWIDSESILKEIDENPIIIGNVE